MKRSLQNLLAFDSYVVVVTPGMGGECALWLRDKGKRVIEVPESDAGVLATEADSGFITATLNPRETADALMRHGVGIDRIFPYVDAMFAAHYSAPGPLLARFLAVQDALSDAESKTYFARIMSFYRSLDPRKLSPNPKASGRYGYDASRTGVIPNGTAIDCGAYTGDTLAEFREAGALWAFEPNLQNFGDLCHRAITQQNVIPRRVALGKVRGLAMVSREGSRSSMGQSGDLVEVDTIDHLFADTPVDYIKIDAEGSDMDVLDGGAHVIKRDRPVIACAAYHKPEHLLGVAERLQQLLGPVKLYASHDPSWIFHLHYIAVPQ